MEPQGRLEVTSTGSTPAEPDSFREALRDINRHCLELLVRSAQRQDLKYEGTQLTGALQNSLATLTPARIEAISRSPFLLVTLCFQQPEWWKAVSTHPGSRANGSPWRRYFPKSAAVRLTRSTVFLAWHSAQSAPELAAITLGLHPQVIRIIRVMNLNAIDRIADHQHTNLMPRWEDRPVVWKHLIDSSDSTNATKAAFTLRGLQLIAGESLNVGAQ